MYQYKFFLLLIFFQLHTGLQAQVRISQPFVALAYYEAEMEEVDSLSAFPEKIQQIVKKAIRNSMTGFESNVHFVRGQISRDGHSPSKDQGFIPAYQLYFEWRDTSMKIDSYCFELSLDRSGKIRVFEWPKKGFTKKEDFTNPERIYAVAHQLAQKKNYKTETCLYALAYDPKSDTFCWRFSFYQQASVKGKKYVREYKTIVVDAKTAAVLQELDTSSVATRD